MRARGWNLALAMLLASCVPATFEYADADGSTPTDATVAPDTDTDADADAGLPDGDANAGDADAACYAFCNGRCVGLCEDCDAGLTMCPATKACGPDCNACAGAGTPCRTCPHLSTGEWICAASPLECPGPASCLCNPNLTGSCPSPAVCVGTGLPDASSTKGVCRTCGELGTDKLACGNATSVCVEDAGACTD